MLKIDKIARLALEAKGFAADVIDAVIVVANATGNVTLAVEMLLGIHEAPEISNVSKVAENAAFSSYDAFNDRVEYNYTRYLTKADYFPVGTEKSDVTLENFDQLKVKYDSNVDQPYYHINTGKTEMAQGNCNLSRWEKNR